MYEFFKQNNWFGVVTVFSKLRELVYQLRKNNWKSFVFRDIVEVWIVSFFLQKVEIEHPLEML